MAQWGIRPRGEPISEYCASGREVRRLPIGAELTSRGTHFRVWAPQCGQVAVVLEKSSFAPTGLATSDDGNFSGLVAHARAGALYRFQLDGDDKLAPDPA